MRTINNYTEPKILKIVNKTVLLLIGLFISSISLNAQINGVTYGIEYNKETCLFDCYISVKDGYARTMRERVQFNAQMTIVVPTGSEMVVEEVYMPLKDNQNFRSNEPIDWYISNEIKNPEAAPGKSFFSIAPALAPSAFYNQLNKGDKVKLFSLNISPIVNCASDVRIYENGIDPSSDEKGMSGSDFRNGFTMGGIEQKYLGNEETLLPNGPQFKSIDVVSGKISNVTLTMDNSNASSCQKNVNYNWYGPNGLIATTNNPSIEIISKVEGKYYVIAKDEIGCESRLEFQPFETSTKNGVEINEGIVSQVSEADGVEYGFNIYPNPAKDFINFTFKGKSGDEVKISIYDQSGRLVVNNALSMKLTQSEESVKIPTDLSSGLYNVTAIINNTQVENQKLIIVE